METSPFVSEILGQGLTVLFLLLHELIEALHSSIMDGTNLAIAKGAEVRGGLEPESRLVEGLGGLGKGTNLGYDIVVQFELDSACWFLCDPISESNRVQEGFQPTAQGELEEAVPTARQNLKSNPMYDTHGCLFSAMMTVLMVWSKSNAEV